MASTQLSTMYEVDMENKQEISRIYSKSEKKMIVLQPNDRPTVAAYKRFKRPAFVV